MRRAAKVDTTHADVVESLRSAGASVVSLAGVGSGCPDLLVGYHGVTWLMEVKGPRGRLRASQLAWATDWRGSSVVIVRSVEDVGRWLYWVARLEQEGR